MKKSSNDCDEKNDTVTRVVRDPRSPTSSGCISTVMDCGEHRTQLEIDPRNPLDKKVSCQSEIVAVNCVDDLNPTLGLDPRISNNRKTQIIKRESGSEMERPDDIKYRSLDRKLAKHRRPVSLPLDAIQKYISYQNCSWSQVYAGDLQERYNSMSLGRHKSVHFQPISDIQNGGSGTLLNTRGQLSQSTTVLDTNKECIPTTRPHCEMSQHLPHIEENINPISATRGHLEHSQIVPDAEVRFSYTSASRGRLERSQTLPDIAEWDDDGYSSMRSYDTVVSYLYDKLL